MAFITALASLGTVVGINVYRSGTLTAERDVIVSAFEKARNLAMSNVGESDHGIYLEDNRHTIFRGSSYASRNEDADIVIVNSSRIIATGTVEFVFEQVSGDALATGTLSIIDDRGVARNISVNEEGGLNW